MTKNQLEYRIRKYINKFKADDSKSTFFRLPQELPGDCQGYNVESDYWFDEYNVTRCDPRQDIVKYLGEFNTKAKALRAIAKDIREY